MDPGEKVEVVLRGEMANGEGNYGRPRVAES